MSSVDVSSPSSSQYGVRREDGVILVTGANGYVGSHVVWQLLEQGYSVRGTVRNPQDPRHEFLKTYHPASESLFELVAADLMQTDCWRAAMDNVSAVIHVASPFQIDPNASEESFVKPAVTGTATVIEAALSAGVKRIVLTSSIASITEGHSKDSYVKGKSFDEHDWTDTNASSTGAYEKSKALAEKKAWELVDGTDTELVVINPGLVFGPVFDKSQGSSSASSDLMQKYLNRKYPALPPLSIGTVDVRDVAAAHIKGIQLPAEVVAGQRFICVAETCSFKTHNVLLSERLKSYGFKLQTHVIPSFALPVASLMYDDLKQAKKTRMLHRQSSINNEKIRNVMDITFRPVDNTLFEHAVSLMKVGLLDPKKTPHDIVDGLCVY